MARPRWRPLAIAVVKSAVAIVVLWAVGRSVLRTYTDLRDRSESLRFEPAWLVCSAALYLAGLLAYAVFFQRILQASSTQVALLPAWRAYVVSHLGKYVPGKAMVVVLRSGMVASYGPRAVDCCGSHVLRNPGHDGRWRFHRFGRVPWNDSYRCLSAHPGSARAL